MPRPLVLVVVGLAAVNAATWLAFRVDKARARRSAWRIRERTLLTLAVAGGAVGALLAMYGHRQRHKTGKRGFAAVVWLAALGQAAAATWWAWTRLRG